MNVPMREGVFNGCTSESWIIWPSGISYSCSEGLWGRSAHSMPISGNEYAWQNLFAGRLFVRPQVRPQVCP